MINLTQSVQKTALNVLWIDEVWFTKQYCLRYNTILDWKAISRPIRNLYRNILFKKLQQGMQSCHGMGRTAGNIEINRYQAVEVADNILASIEWTTGN